MPGIYDPSGSGIYPFGGDAYPDNGFPRQFLPPPQLPRAPKPRMEYPYEEPSPVNPYMPKDTPGREYGDMPAGARPVQYANARPFYLRRMED